MSATSDRWNEMYATDAYIFGTQPNDFLAACINELAPGRLLSLGEGEGRNGVWLATQGFAVSGVDASAVGVEKARALAALNEVAVDFQVGDLADLDLEADAWDVIVSIFAHTPPSVRAHVHRQVVRGLAPGGRYIVEAYHPSQLGRGTGGPSDPTFLVTLEDLRSELPGLDFVVARECERDVTEGERHAGIASVTQLLARKAR